MPARTYQKAHYDRFAGPVPLPAFTVFDAVGGENQLAATVESAKKLIRPLDLDSRDLIQTQYAFVRGALMALYEALDVRAVRGADPAIEALDYAQKLNARGRRVTARRSRLGGERAEAPLGHVTDRWRVGLPPVRLRAGTAVRL